ncbi:MAG TPA: Ig-like domain-containing protein [Planctomycetota bacterium]|nr:Ig-like domain-containing protein [Planctomycetota bacterium]
MKFERSAPSGSLGRVIPRRGGWKALLALALVILVPACGKSTKNTGPTIIGFLPQGPSVARQVIIYIDWDRALDPGTWPTSFTLTDNLGAIVTCSIGFSTANNEISIKPAAALNGGITYTVTVLDTLKGADGTTFPGFAFQFTTAAATATNGGQPTFSGATSATAPAVPPGPPGTIVLAWGTASDSPDGNSIVYDVYLSTSSNGEDFAAPPFISTANATGLTINNLASGVTFYFIVRARESSTGNIDFNTVQVSATTN